MQLRDGVIPQSDSLRFRYGADLVALFVDRANDYAGYASLPNNPDEAMNQAFSVNVRGYLHWDFLLAHELGHNFGCGHDRLNAGDLSYYHLPYNYGHHFSANDVLYATIMSYWPGLYVPHFSNPEISYKGVPTGVSAANEFPSDNAQTIAYWAPFVANHVQPRTFVTFEFGEFTVLEDVGTLNVRLKRSGNLLGLTRLRVAAEPVTAESESDFQGSIGLITFPPNAEEQMVSLEIVDDSIAEGSETFRLVVTSLNGVLAEFPKIQITIEDNDDGFQIASRHPVYDETDVVAAIQIHRIGSGDGSNR